METPATGWTVTPATLGNTSSSLMVTVGVETTTVTSVAATEADANETLRESGLVWFM